MVDDSGGRRRCGDDGRRGEAAALCGVTNGDGGRAGVATEGGHGYRGQWRAMAVGERAAVGRRRRSWAGGTAAAMGGGAARGAGGRRPAVAATGGGAADSCLSSGGRRAARWRVGGRLFRREKERRKRIADCWRRLFRVTPIGKRTRSTGVKKFPSAMLTSRWELRNPRQLGF
jgi:hypothetical protein